MNLPQKISSNVVLSVVLIILFVLSAYSPILNSSFKVIYDTDNIIGNAQVRGLDFNRMFSSSLFKADESYRPLTFTSHALEYQFFSLTPFFYYCFNLLLHILNALLVYALIYLLVQEKSTACLAAILFAIHPAQWQTVSFLSGRPELLNAFFNLASIIFCSLYFRRFNGWWLGISLLCFTAALLSRESRAYVLALFFFYIAFLVPKSEETKGLRWLIFLPYAVIGLLYAGLRQGLSFHLWPHGSEAGLRFLNGVRSIVMEVTNLLAPTSLYFDRSAPEAYDYLTWVALAAVLTALAILWTFRSHLSARFLFFLSWLMMGLWPVMTAAYALDPMAGGKIPVGETFIYLALVPLIALSVLVFQRLLTLSREHHPMAAPVVTVAAAGFISLFFLLTYKNATETFDEIALLEENKLAYPQSVSAQYALGLVYGHHKNYPQAQYYFGQAVKLEPRLVEAQLGLARMLFLQGKYIEASRVYETIEEPGKYKKTVEDNLANVYGLMAANYETAVIKNPQDINAYFSLGVFYSKLGELTKAIGAYQKVVELDPNNEGGLRPLALKFQGMLYAQTGNNAQAQENFERAQNNVQ